MFTHVFALPLTQLSLHVAGFPPRTGGRYATLALGTIHLTIYNNTAACGSLRAEYPGGYAAARVVFH